WLLLRVESDGCCRAGSGGQWEPGLLRAVTRFQPGHGLERLTQVAELAKVKHERVAAVEVELGYLAEEQNVVPTVIAGPRSAGNGRQASRQARGEFLIRLVPFRTLLHRLAREMQRDIVLWFAQDVHRECVAVDVLTRLGVAVETHLHQRRIQRDRSERVHRRAMRGTVASGGDH